MKRFSVARECGMWLGGIALGASAMFLLDPDRGGRRRAIFHDKAVRIGRFLREALARRARQSERFSGLSHQMALKRVRAELGRVVERPRSLSIEIYDGRVSVSGSMSPDEAEKIETRARSMPGIRVLELNPARGAGDGISGVYLYSASARSPSRNK